MDKKRCNWCLKDELYRNYHDNEWGEPSYNDQYLFECLILETFQAGLSWYTILKKRENFRKAFCGFNALKMARFGSEEVDMLLQNAGIIRSRGKIEAAINNAKIFLILKKEFGTFSKYLWQFTNHEVVVLKADVIEDIQSTTTYSNAMARDMKKRGFKYVGSTTCMAYMEAVGMISQHLSYCYKAKT